jgi:hypothetical protein
MHYQVRLKLQNALKTICLKHSHKLQHSLKLQPQALSDCRLHRFFSPVTALLHSGGPQV